MRRGGCDGNLTAMSSPSLLRTIALIALAIVAALAAVASPASAAPRATPYTLPADFALPNHLVTGPDGAVWVTDSSLGRIWRIAPRTGKIRSYDLGQMPTGITVAYGSMWVADAGGDAIHRVETDGSSTRIALRNGAFPTAIAKGSDGALWFTETHGDAIGRLALDGTVTEYPLAPGVFAGDIVPGPDGALYFGEALTGKVGRITTDGAMTEYAMPGDAAMPGGIVSIDGVLYVADYNNSTIDRMTTAGEFTDAFALPRENATPLSLVAGVDGALYIAEHSTGSISRMTLDGTFTKRYKLPGGSPDSIANGPDGSLWIGQGNIGQVTRLDVGLDAPVTAHGTTFDARAGVAATHTVAEFTDADPNARASDYAVTIGWGDGLTTGGTVCRNADGSFTVRGRHTYDRKGTRRVTVRITDGVGRGLDAKVTSTAVVSK
jgi:virginiamycin B lyase